MLLQMDGDTSRRLSLNSYTWLGSLTRYHPCGQREFGEALAYTVRLPPVFPRDELGRYTLHALCKMFGEHHRGQVHIGTRHLRHDRRIHHPEPLHPSHTTFRIDNRVRIV